MDDQAKRILLVAEKLLTARDLVGSRKFAVQAKESNPNLDGVDQILAVADVLLAAEKRINNHHDWYAILQVDHKSNDLELMKRQYKKLAFLLHPDKNRFVFADSSFKLICDAWAMLSDPSKKTLYDNELSMFLQFDPVILNKRAVPTPTPRRSPRKPKATSRAGAEGRNGGNMFTKKTQTQTPPVIPMGVPIRPLGTFWTLCPYCYNLYEYPRKYEECCVRCQNCRRAFHAAVLPVLPPKVPGENAYYCCWAFFPLGYSMASDKDGKASFNSPFMSMFGGPAGEAMHASAASDLKSDKAHSMFTYPSQPSREGMHPSASQPRAGKVDDSWSSLAESEKVAGDTMNVKKSVESTKKGPSSSGGVVANEANRVNRFPKMVKKTLAKRPRLTARKSVINVAMEPESEEELEEDSNREKLLMKTVAKRPRFESREDVVNVESEPEEDPEEDPEVEPVVTEGTQIANIDQVGGVEVNPKQEEEPEEDPEELLEAEPVVAENTQAENIGAEGDPVETNTMDDDAAAGIRFFEGLDDIFVGLPILSVPRDQNK